MTAPDADVLSYPDPPPARLPGPVRALLALVAAAATAAAPLFLTVALHYELEWGPWATAWACLATAVAVGALSFTPVAWARAPKGGWPAEFPLPLLVRVLLRVLLYIGVWGLVFMAGAWLLGSGTPTAVVAIGGTVVLAVAMAVGWTRVTRWCEPVGGTQAMYDHLRPRGGRERDPLTSGQVADVTGRPVAEVVRLDSLHPKVPALRPYFGHARARFVLDDGSHVEAALLILSGRPIGHTAAAKEESRRHGTTPEERLAVVRGDHRLDAVPETGEESYACVPLAGGTEWLWTRLAEDFALEIRTSRGHDRWTRTRLAQAAAERFDRDELLGLD
ncbi:hypothetical protein [Glycomyces tenuis]|uniref:hypothetical protein n=1 Tax=Glycomyces tenuis TaxID=58116 RepID=UPI00042216BD|nr:hypothetical protein [Glycomyces tenuis]